MVRRKVPSESLKSLRLGPGRIEGRDLHHFGCSDLRAAARPSGSGRQRLLEIRECGGTADKCVHCVYDLRSERVSISVYIYIYI